MGNNLDGVKYEPLPIEKINERSESLISFWLKFLEQENELKTPYHIHNVNLFEVITRQDERMYYYKIFHELEYPCEYKFIAIECFWINTLKPFMITDENSKIYNCPNEMFSLFLIIAAIKAIYKKVYPGKSFQLPTVDRMRDILYDFKYCSLSREAMIAFVETFADTYGVGIDYLQKNKDAIKDLYSNNDVLSLWQ